VEDRVHPEQISPDLRLVAVQRRDAGPEVEVWDTMTGSLRQKFRAAQNTFPVAVFRDDHTLRVFDDRGESSILCREWDLLTGAETRTWRLPNPGSGFLRITFSPDGQRCLMTGSSRVVHDLRTGQHEAVAIQSDLARFPRFSPDGNRVATSLMSSHVAKLWEISPLREVATLSSTMSVPHSVAFSPDGRRVAVGAGDREAITLWDAHTHEPLLTLRGHGARFFRTAFSPDGNTLASRNILSGEGNGILHLWRAPSREEIAQAEKAQEASAKKP
jgi:WD40 repeat protein